jgi:hypothetical protein
VAGEGRIPPVIWLCKGFEPETACFPHQVAQDMLPHAVPRGALSGPSFAEEVARGLPAAITLASPDAAFAEGLARELHGPRLRVYSSSDLTGVEVGGAVKNVMAIAAGVCDGMGFVLSARAALMTRGLTEITRLGLALGGRLETFIGLSGAGDLILTCTGDLSRNRRVGLALARGERLPAILAGLGHVAEGVGTAREVRRLATRLAIDMPITEAVCGLLDGDLTPAEAVEIANNTRYGLAASVWSENVNLALDIAPRLRAGEVWINATNLFDAAAGFGGPSTSGFSASSGSGPTLHAAKASWQFQLLYTVAQLAAGHGGIRAIMDEMRLLSTEAEGVAGAMPASAGNPSSSPSFITTLPLQENASRIALQIRFKSRSSSRPSRVVIHFRPFLC